MLLRQPVVAFPVLALAEREVVVGSSAADQGPSGAGSGSTRGATGMVAVVSEGVTNGRPLRSAASSGLPDESTIEVVVDSGAVVEPSRPVLLQPARLARQAAAIKARDTPILMTRRLLGSCACGQADNGNLAKDG